MHDNLTSNFITSESNIIFCSKKKIGAVSVFFNI